MFKWGIISLFIFAGIPALHLCYLYTHPDFNPPDFYYDWVLALDAPVHTASKEEAKRILGQKFFYLGHGRQMTAYESEDHQYVIKFFNPRPVIREKKWKKLKTWRRLSSLKWTSYAYLKRKQRVVKLFHQYHTAFKDLPEETGLRYVHVGKSTCLSQALWVADKKGKLYCVDLDRAPFVLQKKSELVTVRLDRLLEKGYIEKAKQNVEALYRFFSLRAKKGFTDRIQTLHNNYGFVGDSVIQIDLGRLQKVESFRQRPEEETRRIHAQLTQSLSDRFPLLVPFIREMSKKYE